MHEEEKNIIKTKAEYEQHVKKKINDFINIGSRVSIKIYFKFKGWLFNSSKVICDSVRIMPMAAFCWNYLCSLLMS